MHWGVKLDGGPRRVNHAAVAVGDKIYSFGGYCTNDNSAEGRPMDVHILNTNNYRWSVVPYDDNPELAMLMWAGLHRYNRYNRYTIIPFQRYGHTAVSFQDNIYIWGGRNDQYACNRLFCFNTTSNEWKSVTVTGEIPGARDGHSACVYSKFYFDYYHYTDGTPSAYVYDLRTYDTGTPLVWAYDLTTATPMLI